MSASPQTVSTCEELCALIKQKGAIRDLSKVKLCSAFIWKMVQSEHNEIAQWVNDGKINITLASKLASVTLMPPKIDVTPAEFLQSLCIFRPRREAEKKESQNAGVPVSSATGTNKTNGTKRKAEEDIKKQLEFKFSYQSKRACHKNVHKTQLRFEKYELDCDDQELNPNEPDDFDFAVKHLVTHSIQNAVLRQNETEVQHMGSFVTMIQLLLLQFGFEIDDQSKDSDARIKCNGENILDIEWNCFEKLLPGGKNDNTSVLPETVDAGVRNKASILCDVGLLISTSRLVCKDDDDLKKGAEYLKKTILEMGNSGGDKKKRKKKKRDDKKQKTNTNEVSVDELSPLVKSFLSFPKIDAGEKMEETIQKLGNNDYKGNIISVRRVQELLENDNIINTDPVFLFHGVYQLVCAMVSKSLKYGVLGSNCGVYFIKLDTKLEEDDDIKYSEGKPNGKKAMVLISDFHGVDKKGFWEKLIKFLKFVSKEKVLPVASSEIWKNHVPVDAGGDNDGNDGKWSSNNILRQQHDEVILKELFFIYHHPRRHVLRHVLVLTM